MKRGFGVEGAEAPVLSDIGPGPATPFPADGLAEASKSDSNPNIISNIETDRFCFTGG